jgi:hypothetical protein
LTTDSLRGGQAPSPTAVDSPTCDGAPDHTPVQHSAQNDGRRSRLIGGLVYERKVVMAQESRKACGSLADSRSRLSRNLRSVSMVTVTPSPLGMEQQQQNPLYSVIAIPRCCQLHSVDAASALIRASRSVTFANPMMSSCSIFPSSFLTKALA